jgi:hypothetical protein
LKTEEKSDKILLKKTRKKCDEQQQQQQRKEKKQLKASHQILQITASTARLPSSVSHHQ